MAFPPRAPPVARCVGRRVADEERQDEDGGPDADSQRDLAPTEAPFTAEWVAEAQGLAYQFTPTVGLAIAGCAAAGAIIAAFLRKFVVIGITSIVGAAYLVEALEALQRDRRVWLLALSIVAIAWQVIVSRAIAGRKKTA